MIDLMLKTERECQEYKCGKSFMETLLKKMEEAGMLPPYAEISTLEYELDEHGLLGDLIKWVNTAHEWEKEDEDKDS